MKPAEIREMSTEEMVKKVAELREDTLRLRFKLATGELEDTSLMKKTRKDIARIETILAERRRQEVANGK